MGSCIVFRIVERQGPVGKVFVSGGSPFRPVTLQTCQRHNKRPRHTGPHTVSFQLVMFALKGDYGIDGDKREAVERREFDA